MAPQFPGSGIEGRRGVWKVTGRWRPSTQPALWKHEGECPDEGAVRGAAISPEKGGPFPPTIGIGLRSQTLVGAEARFSWGSQRPPLQGLEPRAKLRRPKTNFLPFRLFIKTII